MLSSLNLLRRSLWVCVESGDVGDSLPGISDFEGDVGFEARREGGKLEFDDGDETLGGERVLGMPLLCGMTTGKL